MVRTTGFQSVNRSSTLRGITKMQKLLTREEYDNVVSKFSKDYCALCDKDFKQINVRKSADWKLILNMAPYWPHHLMLHPKRHIEKMSEITSEDFEQIKFLYEEAINLYKEKKITHKHNGKLVDQYILMFRYRDTTQKELKGNKVNHLHIHISPTTEGAFDPILDKDASKIDVDAFLSA